MMEVVKPVSPVAGYIGGKRNLSRRIIERIGAVDHEAYAEAFVGMGGIFLRRPTRPRSETINDWSEDVSTFFRVIQRHYQAFIDMIRWQVSSRSGFEKLAALEPGSLTDLERAARFLYLQRLAFGGKVRGRNFGIDPMGPARFDVSKLVPMIEAVHERLAGVVIERLPWADFIRRYDRPGMLFYLDPPYFGCERDYGDGMFDRAEFAQMAELLGGIKGRFILSINDRPEIRDLFSGFAIEGVDVRYQVGGMDKQTIARELIITNS